MPSTWIRVALVLMLILAREPRSFPWPFGEPKPIGDAIGAVLGICDPDRKRDKCFRDQLGERWGIKPGDLRDLHVRLESIIKAVAKLVTVAHHRDIVEGTDCPRDWRSTEGYSFPLKASMMVVELLVEPATIASLAKETCAVRALSKDMAGSEVGLANEDPARKLHYMKGGREDH